MLRGGDDHPLDQAAVGLLDVGTPCELGASVAKPQCERIADPLELPGGEHPRPADCTDPPLEALAREGGAEQLGELALDLADLAPQVVAGAALRGLGDRSREHGVRSRGQIPGLLERGRHEGSFTRRRRD